MNEPRRAAPALRPLRDAVVAVDLVGLHAGADAGGAKVVALELLRSLRRAAPGLRLTLFTGPAAHPELAVFESERVARRLCAPDADAPEPAPDVVLSPLGAPSAPLAALPCVALVARLGHLRHPERLSAFERRQRELELAGWAPGCARLLCLGEADRRLLAEVPGIEARRLCLLPLHPERRLRLRVPDVEQHAELEQRFGVRRPFLFYPANYWPHKNHRLLFVAYAGRRAQASLPQLVCAGAPESARQELAWAVERMGLRGEVLCLPAVDERTLARLYAACGAVVLPWLRSGLGLPVREAQRFGRPLFCSRFTDPPPAGAAALFDPRQVSEIGAALAAAGEACAPPGAVRPARGRGAGRALLRALRSALPRRRSAAHAARPSLAIVTPSLDQGRFLGEALRSVLEQGLAVEYHVQDGGSRDESLALLRACGGRLRFRSEPDAGQAQALNRGFAGTQGEVLGWLNADDALEPGALLAVQAAFAEDPELDLLYGDADHVDEQGRRIGPYPTEDWSYARLIETCFVCQPAAFFRRRLLERFGPLDERLDYCLDYEYWLRVGRDVRVRHLPRRLARSRLHAGAKTWRARVAMHAEINDMLRRRLGRVPTRWIHNYAFAVVDAAGCDRARPRQYVWRLLAATAFAFVRWQRRLPAEYLDVTRYWLARAYGRGPRA